MADLGCVNPGLTSAGVMEMLNKMQRMPQAEQIMAAAVVFREMLRQSGLRPWELIQYAENLTQSKDGYTPEFKCVNLYMTNEWKF